MQQARWERINPCTECAGCKGRVRCASVRQSLRSYSGVRFTSDGFDCALPVSIDSHSHCSYGCLYCFSDNLVQHRAQTVRPIGQVSLGSIERLFAGEPGKTNDLLRRALKYDRRNENGYPCPIQLGAINDPCDHIERNQGWLLDYIKLAIKYNQPTRISTKGTVFQIPEYLDAIAQAPHLFWVSFSIISCDDEVLERVDRNAPDATERLETMRALSGVGVKTALRFRPILPGISDSTKNYPEAWRVLMEKSAEAGAVAVSYEVGFVSASASEDIKHRWRILGKIAGVPFLELYKKFGPPQACMRPSYAWTENIMHAVADKASEMGLTVGVSDPVWKQLTETGCCCGMLPDDPVFGNWERESATNQLLLAKQTGKELEANDIIPPWAYDAFWDEICNPGVGPLVRYKRKHWTWADELRSLWNEPERQRSPLNYFQGALLPSRREGNSIFYKYQGLERKYLENVPYWNLNGK